MESKKKFNYVSRDTRPAIGAIVRLHWTTSSLDYSDEDDDVWGSFQCVGRLTYNTLDACCPGGTLGLVLGMEARNFYMQNDMVQLLTSYGIIWVELRHVWSVP